MMGHEVSTCWSKKKTEEANFALEETEEAKDGNVNHGSAHVGIIMDYGEERDDDYD